MSGACVYVCIYVCIYVCVCVCVCDGREKEERERESKGNCFKILDPWSIIRQHPRLLALSLLRTLSVAASLAHNAREHMYRPQLQRRRRGRLRAGTAPLTSRPRPRSQGHHATSQRPRNPFQKQTYIHMASSTHASYTHGRPTARPLRPPQPPPRRRAPRAERACCSCRARRRPPRGRSASRRQRRPCSRRASATTGTAGG